MDNVDINKKDKENDYWNMIYCTYTGNIIVSFNIEFMNQTL